MAVISEKTVRISAARVAGLRHSALLRRRMAESITPAWEMPIQNTKFVMKKPHITGRLRPVTPKPLFTSKPAALNPPSTMRPKMITEIGNHFGECRMEFSNSRLIWR